MIDHPERLIDHSLLTPETDRAGIAKLCQEAIAHRFCGIAVNPYWVSYAKTFLTGSEVKIISVSGFPLSANRTDIKVAEAVKGVEDGADEIDMVANIGLLAEGAFGEVENEIAAVRKSLPDSVILKVIIESPRITPETQTKAVETVVGGGADYVKTATGFFGGATVEIVRRLTEAARGRIKVKASGGIRTMSDMEALVAAGAKRIGSSASVAIMHEYNLAAAKTEK